MNNVSTVEKLLMRFCSCWLWAQRPFWSWYVQRFVQTASFLLVFKHPQSVFFLDHWTFMSWRSNSSIFKVAQNNPKKSLLSRIPLDGLLVPLAGLPPSLPLRIQHRLLTRQLTHIQPPWKVLWSIDCDSRGPVSSSSGRRRPRALRPLAELPGFGENRPA